MKNANTNPVAHCATLVDLLRWRAAEQPDRVAYTFLVDGEREEATATYASLDRQACAIAARLQSVGAAGERALLLYPPGLEYIAAFFGCLYAGVTAVPAFPPRPNRPMPRLQTIVADGQVKVALTSTEVLKNIERRLANAPELKALRWLNTDDVLDVSEPHWAPPAIDADRLAFLQYTSGSTSSPKGVMLSHANLLHNLSLIGECFEGNSDCRSVFWLPPYHDMGLIGGILEPLYIGAPAVLMAPAAFLQSPFRWLDAISRTRAVVSGAPNFAYDLCVDKITPEQRARLDLSSWELAFNGAEPVRAETLDRFVEAFAPCGFRRETFYPCYGLAEGTLLATGSRKADPPVFQTVDGLALGENQVKAAAPAEPHARSLVGSGKSPASQRVIIVDPETCVPCPPDRVGEIWVQGPSVARGYWNRPEESARTFAARLAESEQGPFLRTGDLGFLKDGELFVTGRAKDLIILRGKNHYPQDIELTVESSCAAVRPSCSAAFAVEADGEERLVIVAEVERACRKQGLDDAMRRIRQAVAAHHDVPVWSIVLIKTLTIPKTSSGKIQRHVCRQRFLGKELEIVAESVVRGPLPVASTPFPDHEPRTKNHERQATAHGPRTTDHSTLIQAWLMVRISEVLQMPVREVDVREPFARFGMDSMTALALGGDLETCVGCRLPPTVMYDYPSIEALSRHLSEGPPDLQDVSAPHLALASNPERVQSAPVDGPVNRIDARTAQRLLSRLDQLSPEETKALLEQMLAEEGAEQRS